MQVKLNDKNIYVDYIKTILQDNNLYNYTSDLYDHKTHSGLVAYLNNLKQEKKIDLFDLVNLADNNYLNNFELTQVLIEGNQNQKPYSLRYRISNITTEDKLFKIYRIPVSWDINADNHEAEFTIKIDSLKQPIIVAGIGFKNNKVLNNNIYNPSTYYNLSLEDKINIKFNIPTGADIDNSEILNNFYLLIKAPKDTKDIIVTKGDLDIDSDKFISNTQDPVLCQSKLIEYLTDMIIYEGSKVEDILYFQNILNSPEFAIKFNMQLLNYTPGEYDETMISFITEFQKKYVRTDYRKGYIDKDTEREIKSI